MNNTQCIPKISTEEIIIDNKLYSYSFIGENSLRPSTYSYGISEDDITEYDKYEKEITDYKHKAQNLPENFSLVLGYIIYTAVVIYFGWCNYEEEWLMYIPLMIGALIVSPVLVGIINLLIRGLLYILIPNKLINNIVIKIIGQEPKKPDKWNDVNKYKQAQEQFTSSKWKYSSTFTDIDMLDYNLCEYGERCIYSAIKEIESFTNFQNGLIYKDNLRQDQKYWFDLNPFEFELEVAYWFEQQGYESKITKKSGDGGVDVIISKNGYTAYVQCKRFKTSKVDRPTLNALYGVVCADGVNQGIVVSLLGVTNEAKEFAEKVGIRIISVDDLAPKEDLFNHKIEKQPLYALPNQINRSWLKIGNIDLNTNCYRTQEDLQNYISNWKNVEQYHPFLYKGIILCIHCSQENYNKFTEWFYSVQRAISTIHPQKMKKKYKRRYWRY